MYSNVFDSAYIHIIYMYMYILIFIIGIEHIMGLALYLVHMVSRVPYVFRLSFSSCF